MSGPEGNIRILAKTNSFPEPLSLRVLFYSHIFTQRNKFESIKVGTYKNTGLIHKGQRQHPKKKKMLKKQLTIYFTVFTHA